MSINPELETRIENQSTPSLFNRLRIKAGALALLGATFAAGCAVPAPGGGGTGNTYPNDIDDPNTSTWIAGDSNGVWTGTYTPNTFNVAVGGSGFLQTDPTFGRTILENTQYSLSVTGANPENIVVVGGINDLSNGYSKAEIVQAITDFDSQLTDVDTNVVYAVEPTWTGQNNQLDEIGNAIKDQFPDTIDCDNVAESYPGDSSGFHASELFRQPAYSSFGVCVLNNL